MNERQHLHFQIVQLRHLLEQAKDDLILQPQLKERLEDAERELSELTARDGELLPPDEEPFPRAAVFLSGGGVEGRHGISPGLAGQTLIQYDKMYTAQAIHDETVAARGHGKKRRPTGVTTPVLLFTGTPKGSFGLEFVPREGTGAGDHRVHGESLRKLAKTLQRVASLKEEESLRDLLADVPPAVIKPMKQFFKRLASYGAELRLALPDAPSTKIAAPKIRALANRLEAEINQKPLRLQGTFRGVTLETGSFNFISDIDNELIEGRVSDEMTDAELDHVHHLTNKKGEVHLLRTTITRAGTAAEERYVLLRARALEEPAFEEEQDD